METFCTLTCLPKGSLLLQIFQKQQAGWTFFLFCSLEEKKNQCSIVDVGVLSLIHYSTSLPNTLAFLLASLNFLMGNVVSVTLKCFFNLALGI